LTGFVSDFSGSANLPEMSDKNHENPLILKILFQTVYGDGESARMCKQGFRERCAILA